MPDAITDSGEPRRLDFSVEVLCPCAWRTSLWIREVMRMRPLEGRTHPMRAGDHESVAQAIL